MTSSKRPEQLRGLRASELEMNPRRYPRTMQEAFGPYVTRDLEPLRAREGYPWLWWAALALAGLTTLVLVVLTR